MIAKLVGCVLLTVGLAGCSIRPTPGDWTSSNTLSIVQHVRCEVREALRIQLINYLKSQQLLFHQMNPNWGRLQSLISKLQKPNFDFATLKPAEFSENEKTEIARVSRIGIGYTFRFQITETNNRSIDAAFTIPLPTSSFSLSTDLGSVFFRENERTFNVKESFGTVVYAPCNGLNAKNFVYPLEGKIGVDEIIDTYLGLVQVSNLNIVRSEISEQIDDDIILNTGLLAGKTTISEYSDRIQFSTTIDTGLDPTLSIDPVPGEFRPTSFSGMFGDDRVDLHEVTVALAPTPVEQKTSKKEVELGKGFSIVVELPAQTATGTSANVSGTSPNRSATLSAPTASPQDANISNINKRILYQLPTSVEQDMVNEVLQDILDRTQQIEIQRDIRDQLTD